jgi:hypothetical protein
MRIPHLRFAVVALTSGMLLSGCAYDTYGSPYGYGYGPQGGVSLGVGYGGGYGGYYGGYGYGYPSSYYGGYGYSYGGYDPFGWYGDSYYPGTGIYVYDSGRNRHVWNNNQQQYWTQRRQQWQSHGGSTGSTSANWSGWNRNRDTTGTTTTSTSTSTGTGGWRGHRHGG